MLSERRYGLTKDDYIIASMMLYIDFIRIFYNLVRFFGKRK
jgi:FtsH-binding integral membrane protein